MKICTKCKEEKEETEFSLSGRKPSKYLNSYCKICLYQYQKDNIQKYRESHRVANAKSYRNGGDLRIKQKRIVNREEHLWYSAKLRAKKQNIPFNIEISDIIIPEYCPYLNTILTRDDMFKHDPNSPSLDKIIPELGYTKGNIMVISYKANLMKNNASREELLVFANNCIKLWTK